MFAETGGLRGISVVWRLWIEQVQRLSALSWARFRVCNGHSLPHSEETPHDADDGDRKTLI